MTIISHNLHYKGADGDWSVSERKYKAVYRFISDDPTDGPATVFDYIAANGLPNPTDGTTYSYGNDVDASAFCSSVSAPSHVQGSQNVWEVSCEFSTDSSQGSVGKDVNHENTNDKLNLRPEITTSYSMVNRPVRDAIYRGGYTAQRDAAFAIGTKMRPMSSADGIFDPPLEKEVALQKVTIAVNRINFDNTVANTFINTVNSVRIRLNAMAVLGYPDIDFWLLDIEARTGKIIDYRPSIKSQTINNQNSDNKSSIDVDYLHIECDILIDPEGWRVDTPDIDWHRSAKVGEANGRGGIITAYDRVTGQAFNEPIKAPNGELVARKVMLNGNGQPLNVQDPANVVLLNWQVYKERDHSQAPIVSDVFQSF